MELNKLIINELNQSNPKVKIILKLLKDLTKSRQDIVDAEAKIIDIENKIVALNYKNIGAIDLNIKATITPAKITQSVDIKETIKENNIDIKKYTFTKQIDELDEGKILLDCKDNLVYKEKKVKSIVRISELKKIEDEE